jgi:hypothetical protein
VDESPVHNQGPVQGQNIGQSQQITQHFYPSVPAPLSQKPKRVLLEQQNRERMLRRLRRAYRDLMSQSLQGAAWLELGLAERPDAIQNAANLLLRVESRAERHLSPSTSITEVYDEAEHELLILGEPGTGKSTLLLDLAKHLVERAEKDQIHPLPVILPLSTWAVKRGSLQDWMAEQISEIYDVPRKVSTEWVRDALILPLLDGLDEMDEAARPACIAAINTYHRDHLAKLVVCSRTTEYKAASEHSRLTLQGAVMVQPLQHSHVDTCLIQAGKPLAALRYALKKNTALHDLATTPLMLNILMLTYQGRSVRDLPHKEATLLQQVWDDYVERMVMRKGNPKRYPLAQTRARLSYLAGQMRDHNQTVFYLEHLQPDWLEASQQRIYTRLAVRLPALVIGVLISILVSMFFTGKTSLPSLLQYGVLGGLLGGIVRFPTDGGGRKHHRLSRKHLVKRLAVSICIGLIFGLSLRFSFDPFYTFDRWLIDGLSSGVIMAGGCLLLQYRLAAPGNSSLQNTAVIGWKRVLRFFGTVQGPRALLVATVTGLSVGLGYVLSEGLTYGPGVGLSEGLTYGLGVGLSYALISLILGAQTDAIYLTERMRWTWRSLFKPGHLRITALISCISIIFIGLSYWLRLGLSAGLAYWLSYWLSAELIKGLIYGLSEGLIYGLGVGLAYWFVLGLIQGVTQEHIEDQDRRVANQGIRRSLRNSMVISIVIGAIIGSIGILSYGLIKGLIYWLSGGLAYGLSYALSYGLSYALTNGLRDGLSIGPLIGMSGALLICMLTGGLATFRHYTIRSLLSRSHTFPMRAPQFLNDATARILLRRVGGGYSFVHRLLLDHLADAAGRSTEQTSASMMTPASPPFS